MKCPYRMSTTFIKPSPITIHTTEGEVTITKLEHTDFEECYGEECPFYKDDNTRLDPYCAKVDGEVGGDFL